jgi:thioredoxin 1
MRTSRAILPLAAAAAFIAIAAGCGDGRASSGAAATIPAAGGARLPRLVDFGAGKCIPCKAMAPILAQLRTDFTGRMDVEFVDVWVNPDAGQPYGVRMIPTQLFFSADGRELSRHEGFMSREEILARWGTLGVTF